MDRSAADDLRVLSPLTYSRLVLPRPALAGALRGVVLRDTRAARLVSGQRFNHFPASPLCALTWWFEGESLVLPAGAPAALGQPMATLPSRCLFSGPATRPVTSWNPGPLQVLMALMPTDAMHRLTGLDMAGWVDRWDDARAVLPPDWGVMLDAVAAEGTDEQRIGRLEDFLVPRWAALRPAQPVLVQHVADWAQSLAAQAMLGASGRSLRQIERRVRRWSGLPMRELRGQGRGEQAFLRGRACADRLAAPDWAGLALDSGYADQSHLCRETRRLTGFSPDELRRRIQGDEGFWLYRLWC